MSPDQINALFELVGGIFLWKNFAQLRKDKMLRGVHWVPIMFFASWGYWNLFYYPHLGQWWSFAGGLNIVAANTAWLVLAWKYRRN